MILRDKRKSLSSRSFIHSTVTDHLLRSCPLGELGPSGQPDPPPEAQQGRQTDEPTRPPGRLGLCSQAGLGADSGKKSS